MLKGATIHFNFLFDESHLWIASDESHMYCLIRVTECFVTNWDQNNNGYGYGCSFVAKLNWKKKFFLKKYLCFLQIIHYLQKKMIKKKKFILIFFCLLKKLYLQKMKNIYISFEEYFLSRKYIFILQKKHFLIIKTIFVKTSWWTQ